MADWDSRFLQLAATVASWSKDPSTKVGCVAVSSTQQLLSIGWNGFPRGVHDLPTRLEVREEKLARMVHAEQNCVYNSSQNGISLRGSTMYIHGLHACSECSKAVIQSGVTKLMMEYRAEDYDRWKESCLLAREMLTEAGVSMVYRLKPKVE